MLIEWYGHACFRLKLNSGINITIDPFDDTIGFPQPSLETDIALISHHHFDHSCMESLKGDYVVYDKPGVYENNGVKITGIKTYHDRKQGGLRGENIVFKIEAEGLLLCHLGDLGEEITEELVEKIGHCDVLMIPVGGMNTLNGREALNLLDRLEPNIALPMHYRVSGSDLPIEGIHPFLECATGILDISKSGKNYLDITKERLKKRARVIVLNTPIGG